MDNHDIPDPGKHPYLSEVLPLIREVKDEGLLNLSSLKSGDWYKVLMENRITMETDIVSQLQGLWVCFSGRKRPINA